MIIKDKSVIILLVVGVILISACVSNQSIAFSKFVDYPCAGWDENCICDGIQVNNSEQISEIKIRTWINCKTDIFVLSIIEKNGRLIIEASEYGMPAKCGCKCAEITITIENKSYNIDNISFKKHIKYD